MLEPEKQPRAAARQRPSKPAAPAIVAAPPAPEPEMAPAPATALAAVEAAEALAPAPALAAAPETAVKGTDIMATTAETLTQTAAFPGADKLNGFFADAQGRARTAVEKTSKFYEELGELSKGNVEAVMASARVAASGVESLGQDAVAYGRKSLEQATAAFKSLAGVRSPSELFQLHSDFARQSFDAAVAEGSALSEKMVKLAGEVAQPISSRFAVAAEKLKSAAL